MDLLKLFGFGKKEEPAPYPYKEILHLWDDDYLMVELLPAENRDYVISEVKRISKVASDNISDSGYSDIAPVSPAHVVTLDKQIPLEEVKQLFAGTELGRILVFHAQGVGLLEGESAPLGFGTNTFAIMCEREGDMLAHIWITGSPIDDENKGKLVDALLAFTGKYQFIGVNWYKCKHYNMVERQGIEDFINDL